MFFQWRAVALGAEKFHSAMLPHAGTSSRVWREVVELGDDRRHAGRAARLAASRQTSPIVWDCESFWAQDLEWRPSVDLSPRASGSRRSTRAAGATASPSTSSARAADLSGYRLVDRAGAVPAERGDGREPRAATSSGGGTLLVSYFSGIVDENDAVHAGGYPRAAARRARALDRGVPAAARGRTRRASRAARLGHGLDRRDRARGRGIRRALHRRPGGRHAGDHPQRARRRSRLVPVDPLDDLARRVHRRRAQPTRA